MIRMVFAFLFLFVVFFLGLKAFKEITKEEKWELTKLIGFSILCASLTLGVLTGFVLLF
jgi:hypothetical protein